MYVCVSACVFLTIFVPSNLLISFFVVLLLESHSLVVTVVVRPLKEMLPFQKQMNNEEKKRPIAD